MSIWIESHASLARHPKLSTLARRLGISRVAAIGHLHMLWWWAVEYARDGDLSRYSADAIADAAEWPALADDLLSALRECGFLDGNQLHDWSDYMLHLDAAEERRERTREKTRSRVAKWKQRNAKKQPGNASTQRYPSVPQRYGNESNAATKPNQTNQPILLSEEAVCAEALPFLSPEFVEAWRQWKQHRVEIRKPLKPTATKAQLKKLAAMGEQRAVAAINHSLANQWTGIFEDNAGRNQSPTNGHNRTGTGFRHTNIASSDYRGISD